MKRKTRTSTVLVLSSLLVIASSPALTAGGAFRAHLSGGNEVPTPVDTHAQGQAILKLSADGERLDYKLIVANIDDVFMAHIHLAPAGANGPIVAWLYPDAPPPVPIPGTTQGVLAQGTITAADLMGPLAGGTVANLVAAIEAGETYVNVHTDANPGGEIRGQLFGESL